MQTNDVTFLYLLVVFDAISAQTIVMSTAHILLPNVHHTKSIYACALYSWPVSFQPRIQIMVVVVADVVVVILGFLFFRRFFYASPRALYQVLSLYANKNTKDKKI